MGAYWERTRAEAAIAVSKRNGVNLARELAELYRQHKELARRGYEKIVPPNGGEGLEPSDLEDALTLFGQGSFGLRDIVKILSGGQPVQPPRNVDPEFRWNEPIEANRKTRRAKR